MSELDSTTEATTPARQLRVAGLVIQPELVWDNGTELSPAPAVNPFKIGLGDIGTLREQLAGQLEQLATDLSKQEQ